MDLPVFICYYRDWICVVREGHESDRLGGEGLARPGPASGHLQLGRVPTTAPVVPGHHEVTNEITVADVDFAFADTIESVTQGENGIAGLEPGAE